MSEKPRPPVATHPALAPPDFLTRFLSGTLTDAEKAQVRAAWYGADDDATMSARTDDVVMK